MLTLVLSGAVVDLPRRDDGRPPVPGRACRRSAHQPGCWRLMGRVLASRVVEVAQPIGVPELLRLDRARAGGPPVPGATMVNLESRPASILLPNSRVVFVLCPRCESRRRALFWVGGRLACRRCHRLPYQSQTHGHWTGPLVDALHARCRLLVGRPGPKGRRYRAWLRRVERVDRQAKAWLDCWDQRWGPSLRGELHLGRKLRRATRHMGGRF